ncbi:MAG: zinc-ribbon domain-containing protein [Prevotellaceae bacterium]|nr:zinc-ribbon domain-containing protein [Candidatus Colivivens equi]
MSYCAECGTKLVDGVRFCPKCGAEVESSNNELTNASIDDYLQNATPTWKSFLTKTMKVALVAIGVLLLLAIIIDKFVPMDTTEQKNSNETIEKQEETSNQTLYPANLEDEYEDEESIREKEKIESLRKIKPFIGVWTQSRRDEEGLMVMYLTIREDGTAKFEAIDRGSDGLSMSPILSLSFDEVQIHGNTMLLLKNGATLSQTPSLTIIGNTIENFEKQK